jgi:hypothetical protein
MLVLLNSSFALNFFRDQLGLSAEEAAETVS